MFLRHRVQISTGAHPASYLVGTDKSFPGGKSCRSVNLTTHLHLVPRLKLFEALSAGPLNEVVLSRRGNLFFNFLWF